MLMSATVDPSAFQAYFPGLRTVEIPGKTNYPIEELFLEDFWGSLPLAGAARATGRKRPSAFEQGPLPGLPLDPQEVAQELPECPWHVAEEVARVHALGAEDIELDVAKAVVEYIHLQGDEGGILVFVPGWAAISDLIQRYVGLVMHRYFGMPKGDGLFEF